MTGDGAPHPVSAAPALVLPIVSAIVYDSIDRRHILLQRRDKPGEPVRGRLELPGGRWEAGERPDVAIAREILEETGIVLTAVAAAVSVRRHPGDGGTATALPLAVVAGIDGAYPSLHVLFECYGEGEPRPVPDETSDPRWWPVDEVVALLDSDSRAFIPHTESMLRAGLGALNPPREPPP